MCNHYDFRDPEAVFDFMKAFEGVEEPPPWETVATAWPKSKMPVIYGGNRARTTMRWGVWPHYVPTMPSRLVTNARDDFLLTKSIWKSSAKKRRCLVPADGYFEFTGPKGAKWEAVFHLPQRRPFFMAGLWSPDPDGIGRGFTIVTTKPNALIEALPHDRMPVILSDEAAGRWIGDEALPDDELLAFCVPYGGELHRFDLAPNPRRPVKIELDPAPLPKPEQAELF